MAKRIMFPMELQMWGGIPPQFQTHPDIIQYRGASINGGSPIAGIWGYPHLWNPHSVGETYPVDCNYEYSHKKGWFNPYGVMKSHVLMIQ